MAAQSDLIGVAVSGGIMAAGIATPAPPGGMQKNGYVRSLQITGVLIALMGFLGLAVQVWTVVRSDRPSNHRTEKDRSDRTHWNDNASLFGAASASDSN
jgi:hypothetical protein